MGAARVVAYAAANGGAVDRRGVGGVVEAMAGNLPVEGCNYDTRLHSGPTLLRVHLQEPI